MSDVRTEDRVEYVPREPCKRCGCDKAFIAPAGGQDVVRCWLCRYAMYNAPRTETGKEPRTSATVHRAIRSSQRARVLARGTGRCELCGARGDMHVAHIVSVAVGLNIGLTDAELNDDENLVALCSDCNLGQGAEPMSLRLAVAILRARIAWATRECAL